MKKFIALLVLTTFAFPCFAFEQADNPTPVTVPAQEAKTYSKLWVRSVNIRASTPTAKAFAYITLVPWDGDGSVLTAPVKTVAVQDLFEKAKTDTEIAQAIDLIIKIADRLAGAN
jgi:hypothetical protein